MNTDETKIITAVVIPSYKVKNKILDVIARIGSQVSNIYVVDDCCPDRSGEYVLNQCEDNRVKVLFNKANLGVGGAVITGYKQALLDNNDIVVKIDGDGQMAPEIIDSFLLPIINCQADYTKGNRFYNIDDCKHMPILRTIGNAALSFFNKFSSGYYEIFDPTNGYTAISTTCLKTLPLEKLSERYFFESDILFRLSISGAVVKDIPMKAVYEDEKSNLRIHKILLPFLAGHANNIFKRIVYSYFIRNFSIASLELVLGISLLGFGLIFGIYKWIWLHLNNSIATSGTVMLAALPIILGTQFILSFLNYDMQLNSNKISARYNIKACAKMD